MSEKLGTPSPNFVESLKIIELHPGFHYVIEMSEDF